MARHITTWAPRDEQRAELAKAILDLHERGVSSQGIAAALDVFLRVGLTPLQVRSELRRLGVKRSNRGGRNPVPQLRGGVAA
jgi:hypothetical protein